MVTKIATPYSTGHIPCPYGCGRSFKHATQKAIHIRKVHTGERPFVCKVEDCKKAFYSSGDLKSHEKTHLGLKPFECPSCGKALSSRNALKVHTKALHTLDRPFKCEVPGCGMTYMTRLDLDRHLKKHNKWEQKEEKAKMLALEKRAEKAEKKVTQLQGKLDKKEVREQKRAVGVVSAGKLLQFQPGDGLAPEGAVAYFVPHPNYVTNMVGYRFAHTAHSQAKPPSTRHCLLFQRRLSPPMSDCGHHVLTSISTLLKSSE